MTTTTQTETFPALVARTRRERGAHSGPTVSEVSALVVSRDEQIREGIDVLARMGLGLDLSEQARGLLTLSQLLEPVCDRPEAQRILALGEDRRAAYDWLAARYGEQVAQMAVQETRRERARSYQEILEERYEERAGVRS